MIRTHKVNVTRSHIAANTDKVEVRLYLEGTAEYDYEPPSHTCPGGESFSVLSLHLCHVEFEKKHDEGEVMNGDWRPCGGWWTDFEITHETDIVAFCNAWGVDPFELFTPEDIDKEEGPDSPDPDEERL